MGHGLREWFLNWDVTGSERAGVETGGFTANLSTGQTKRTLMMITI